MGKKTKKTKWRTLEISLPIPGKNYHENGTVDNGWRTSFDKHRRSTDCDKIIKSSAAFGCDTKDSFKENHTKVQLEDEYTKITTPRQDVLFKKGYLTRRKALHHICDENIADNITSNEMVKGGVPHSDCASNGDEEFCDYMTMTTDDGSRLSVLSPVQPQSQLLCTTSQPYIDASSAAIYYGGGYEIYDPYTGSVTALVVGTPPTASSAAAATCQPILTSMPCRPVPLQPLQWFNPVPSSSEWCCDANTSGSYAAIVDDTDCVADDTAAKVSHSSDSTNASVSAAESSSANENTIPATNGDGPLYSHPSQSYIYPSYMFGTPMYSIEDDATNIQYCSADSPILSSNQSAITKRKKRRKRRRHFGETEEDSESGVEDNLDEYVSSIENAVDCMHDDEYEDNAVAVVDTAAIAAAHNQKNGPFSPQTALQGGRDCTGLPHASINAPPFIPANRNIFGCGTQMSLDSHRFASERSSCRLNNTPVENKVNNVAVETKSSSLTNAVETKSLTDSPSSSNNSDSGISSPGSEDGPSISSHQDLRKSVQADRPKISLKDATVPINDGNAGGFCYVTAANATNVAFIPPADKNALSNDKSKNCDTSSSTEAKYGHDDKRLKKIRVKNTGNRVKRCNSNNEDRNNIKRCVSEKEINNGRLDLAEQNDESVDCRPADNPANDESVENAKSVVVFGDESIIITETCSKNSTKVEKTSRIEQTLVFDEIFSTYGDLEDISVINDAYGTVKRREEQQPSQKYNKSPDDECAIESLNKKTWPVESGNDAIEIVSARGCLTSLELAVSPADVREKDRGRNGIAPLSHVNLIGNVDENDAYADNEAGLLCQLDESAGLRMETAIAAIQGLPPQSSVEENVWPSKVAVDAGEQATQHCGVGREVAQSVALAAQIIVDEIVQQAELRIHSPTFIRTRTSTTKCDKFQLPLTQAVTNWLNERGGLPAVVHDFNNDHQLSSTQPSDESLNCDATRVYCENIPRSKKSKASSSNCVIS